MKLKKTSFFVFFSLYVIDGTAWNLPYQSPWTTAQADSSYKRQDWLRGCNLQSSTGINQLFMERQTPFMRGMNRFHVGENRKFSFTIFSEKTEHLFIREK